MIITSFSNPKIKAIRKLEDKKYRDASDTFFIEGLRIVGEAIQTGAQIQSLVVSPELLISSFGKSLLENSSIRNCERIEVSGDIFKSLTNKEGPQGIGAVVKQNWGNLQALDLNPTDLWIALDQVADPGNLGAIMRTADAVGACGVIIIGPSTDPHDPIAIKASMGSIFSLQLVRTDWQTFHSWGVQNKINLIGTSDRAPKDYQSIQYQLPVVLLMGNERHGLPEVMMNACHDLAKIPMIGRADSLNLAVATALMLYEIFNQNRKLDTI